MTSLDPKNISVEDVVHANDLLEAAGQSDAVALLQETLSGIGYEHANNTPTLIRSTAAKRQRKNESPVSETNATANAKILFAMATGAELPAQNTDEPAANEPEAPESEPVAAARTAPETKNPAKAAEKTAKTESGVDFEPFVTSRISEATFDVDQMDAIDEAIKNASGGKIGKLQNLLSALRDAEQTVMTQDEVIYGAREKLAKIQQDPENAEKHAEITIGEFPSFKPSGLSAVAFSGGMSKVLDALLANATEKALSSVSEIVDALKGAEARAMENAKAMRQTEREMRMAMPKKRIAIASGERDDEDLDDGSLDCEIVMRRAVDVFPDAFGNQSPILDFDIPTLEWDTPNPDVPEIDRSFRFFAPALADCLDCLVANEIPWMSGESGCGKSEFFLQIAARTGFPCFRMNMDSHLSRGDIVGTNRLVPGPTGAPIMKFIEGLVPRALRRPSILLIDEMDCGDPEIMPVLQPVLEGRGVRLLEDGGRYVTPHEWSRIAVTANTIGLGSSNQMYLNVHEQSQATRDRISRFIRMGYLPADKELEVVMTRIPDADEDFAKQVIALAGKVREGYSLGEVHQVFSTRTVLRAVRRHAKFLPLYGDEHRAVHSTLEVTILNRCDDDSRAVVKGAIDAIFQ